MFYASGCVHGVLENNEAEQFQDVIRQFSKTQYSCEGQKPMHRSMRLLESFGGEAFVHKWYDIAKPIQKIKLDPMQVPSATYH